MQVTGKAECMPWDLLAQVSSTKGKKGRIYLLENSPSPYWSRFQCLIEAIAINPGIFGDLKFFRLRPKHE